MVIILRLIVLLLGLASVVILVGKFFLRYTQDPREPPALDTAKPFVGTMMNMFINASRYFLTLRRRHIGPIYTIRTLMPGGSTRAYIVTDPKFIQAIQREPRIFSVQALLDRFAVSVCGLSRDAGDVQASDLYAWMSEQHKHSPAHETYRGLEMSQSLDAMNRVMVKTLEESMDLSFRVSLSKKVAMYEWIRDQITLATTDGVYGEKNPYRNAEVRKAFWAYEKAVGTLSSGILSNFLAHKGIKARAFLANTWSNYFQNDDYLLGSDVIQQRYRHHVSRGFAPEDIALFEAANGLALLPNTVPTAFWLVYHLFSHPTILEACRREIVGCIIETKAENGSLLRTIDVLALKSSRSILVSTLNETLRMHNVGLGPRMIMKDFQIDDGDRQYILKQGNILFIPTAIQHFEPSIWGPEAHKFNHTRFLSNIYSNSDYSTRSSRSQSTPTQSVNPSQSVSFRPWGGGLTKCPGRHFATTELLIFAAMLILRFTIIPTSGEWREPKTNRARMTSVMPPPDNDFEVEICKSDEDVGVKWIWKLRDSKSKVEAVS